MNVKQRVLDLNFQSTGENAEITELMITIITKYQLFEPCMYLSEDEEWINVNMVSPEDENISQAITIKKSEITMLGIFNRREADLSVTKTGPEVFYQ